MSALSLLNLLITVAIIYFIYSLLKIAFQQAEQKNNFKDYLANANLLTTVERQEIAATMVDEEKEHKKQTHFFLIAGFVIILLLCVLTFFAQTTFNLIYVIFALLILVAIGALIYKARIIHRNNRLVEQLPSAINMLVQYTLANVSLTESFQLLAKQLPKPSALFFEQVSQKIAGGATLAAALRDSARPYKIFQLDYFVIVLILQQETGADTIKILRRLEHWLRQEQVLGQKVKTLKADIEMGQWGIALAVLFMLSLQLIMAPERVGALLSSPLGFKVFVVGIGLYIIGVIIVRRVMKVV